ncbi:uncharacterized protein LOC142531527 isoform X2 [Primulina tabacum]|uniref:uncharacterized protein LOC142531527 isoform X2 n=1 Tax=Primulina tabacum TaxID=48773 RepID=UPI003F5A715E
MVKMFGKTPKNNPTFRALMRLSRGQRLISRTRSFPYRMLPEQQLKLSVLKLDGSCFSNCSGFHVGRNATVSRLKMAVEEEFKLSLNDEGNSLWPLVWSHFCLCYQNQKLINDRACIQSYGIRDGDQLHFIQYLRMDNAPVQEHSKYQMIESKQRIFACEAKRDDHVSVEDQNRELKCFHSEEEEEENLDFPEAKSTVAGRLMELVSRSKFPGLKRTCEDRTCSVRILRSQ